MTRSERLNNFQCSRTLALLEHRRTQPFVDSANVDAEPRILLLVPAESARVHQNGRITFAEICDLRPLIAASGLSVLWLFRDADTDSLVAGIRARRRQIVVNTMGDPDLYPTGRAIAAEICRHFPSFNSAARLGLHRRENVSSILTQIAGLDVPRCLRISSSFDFAGADLTYPIIVRKTGTSRGETMSRAQHQVEACAAINEIRGEAYATEYREARGSDGWYRKYRVMLIGGEPHPAHIHFSRSWITTRGANREARADNPWMNDEEERFVMSPLSDDHGRIFASIHERIGTDMYGVDYTVGPDGALIFFEANGFHNLAYPRDGDSRSTLWVKQRAIRAARALLAKKIMTSEIG